MGNHEHCYKPPHCNSPAHVPPTGLFHQHYLVLEFYLELFNHRHLELMRWFRQWSLEYQHMVRFFNMATPNNQHALPRHVNIVTLRFVGLIKEARSSDSLFQRCLLLSIFHFTVVHCPLSYKERWWHFTVWNQILQMVSPGIMLLEARVTIRSAT